MTAWILVPKVFGAIKRQSFIFMNVSIYLLTWQYKVLFFSRMLISLLFIHVIICSLLFAMSIPIILCLLAHLNQSLWFKQGTLVKKKPLSAVVVVFYVAFYFLLKNYWPSLNFNRDNACICNWNHICLMSFVHWEQ